MPGTEQSVHRMLRNPRNRTEFACQLLCRLCTRNQRWGQREIETSAGSLTGNRHTKARQS